MNAHDKFVAAMTRGIDNADDRALLAPVLDFLFDMSFWETVRMALLVAVWKWTNKRL